MVQENSNVIHQNATILLTVNDVLSTTKTYIGPVSVAVDGPNSTQYLDSSIAHVCYLPRQMLSCLPYSCMLPAKRDTLSAVCLPDDASGRCETVHHP